MNIIRNKIDIQLLPITSHVPYYQVPAQIYSKIHGANMGPTWVLSAPGESHVNPMNFAIRDCIVQMIGMSSPECIEIRETYGWCRCYFDHHLWAYYVM